MDAVIVKRPTGITITAWLWIAIGSLMMLSALMASIVYSTMKGTPPPPRPMDMPGEAVLMFMLRNFGVFLAVQAVVAVVAIGSGAFLLRLRSWARTAIELLSWLGLLYVVGFGIFWLYTWIDVSGRVPAGVPAVEPATFRIMGMIPGVVMIAVFGSPLGIMIRYLRGPEARAATARPLSAGA